MLTISRKGSFKKTKDLLNRNVSTNPLSVLHRYGKLGVDALSSNTPTSSGETAASWTYEVVKTNSGYRIAWHNTHMAGETPVAILIQYGHATKNGGYVEGIDFINPAMKSIFNGLAVDIWKEVGNE